MGIDHQADIGADGFAHETDSLQVLLGAESGAHFVGRETHFGDGGGLAGIVGRLHIHSRAAIELDGFSLGAAEQVRDRAALELGTQIEESHLHRRRRRSDPHGVAADQRLADFSVDFPGRRLMSGAGGKAFAAHVGDDANDHRVALHNRSQAAEEGEFERFFQRAGKQDRVNFGDSHSGRRLGSLGRVVTHITAKINSQSTASSRLAAHIGIAWWIRSGLIALIPTSHMCRRQLSMRNVTRQSAPAC